MNDLPRECIGEMLPPIALSPVTMPPQREVHIWWLALTEAAPSIALTPEEKQRASQFAVAADRDRFIRGRAFLNGVCGAYTGAAPGARSVAYDLAGRPHVPDSGLFCSASHSGELILVGVATRPVGVDVEEIRAGNIDHAL